MMPGSPVDIVVEAGTAQGELAHLWAAIGYDEINWTYTPRGKKLLCTLGQLGRGPYFVRSHNMFTSGTGLGLPHWGAGNVYHERSDGTPWFDFQLLDRAYDVVVETGHVPIVEFGFTPRPLVPDDARERFAFEPGSPSQYSEYEAGWWSFPPKSLARWEELVRATVQHCAQRYGRARVRQWLWEVWNEPDIGYWRGSFEDYLALYRATVEATRSVLPGARVGGPATTGDLGTGDLGTGDLGTGDLGTGDLGTGDLGTGDLGPHSGRGPHPGLAGRGPTFLGNFLDACVQDHLPLDFVSFHTKGVYFRPWRSYLPPGQEVPEPQSPSMVKMLREVREALGQVASHPGLSDVECFADECDASVPAHHGRFDNSNFGYRDTEYYPVFQCCLMKKLLDLEEVRSAHLRAACAWAFYIEGERCFEGTRSFVTYGDIEKPVLNGYRLLGKLGRRRLRASSSGAWPVRLVDEAQSVPEEVDVLAAGSDDGRVSVLVWRHDDDQYHREGLNRAVTIRARGLGPGPVLVRQWVVDATNANSHTAWRALGAPDYPTGPQIGEIMRAGQLQPAEPDRLVEPDAGEIRLDLYMRLPSVALLETFPSGPAPRQPCTIQP
jgi:xylan 1,4-beta-xylosidase